MANRFLTEMSSADVEVLRRARDVLEHPGLAAQLSNLIGGPLEVAMKSLPRRWSAVVQRATERSLLASLEAVLASVDTRRRPPRRNGVHRALVAGSGAAGGVFGLVALPIELPVSTMIMLRSIADIARSEGEDLRSIETKLACVQVFALGGRSSSDDASESGYFTVRATLAAAIAEAAKHFAVRGGARQGAPAVVRLIAEIASRFGATVTQKVAAQAVPVVGAAGGAAINLLFIKHFQDMAWAHFSIRRLERSYGPELVERAYRELLS